MPEVLVKKDGVEDIEFYGAVDKNKKGQIASHMPAWYLTQHKEELDKNIDELQGALDRGFVPDTEKELHRDRLVQFKKKRDEINESQPHFTENQKDQIDKISTEIGKKISAAMYTRSDMIRGTADAHEEARRMADPCIKLSGHQVMLAKKAGCKISDVKGDAMISRTDAERVWKFCKKAIDEPTNTELLRKP
jgi:hypothetical protein